jgi:DNA-binding GntR family transcriptional regulator
MNLPQNRLSDWIVLDVVAHLGSGVELPFRLTTSEIARHYGSSRTPVNQAIEELIRRGLLEKLPNGRLIRPPATGDRQSSIGDSRSGGPIDGAPPMPTRAEDFSRPGRPAGKWSVPAGSGAESGSPGGTVSVPAWEVGGWRVEVREQLVQEVIRLSLQGQTTFLREHAWSHRLGIGRGILRQLLSQLAGQGIVVHVPRRGWRVHPFSDRDMWQYLEIREVLELKALELAQGHLDSDRLQEMLAGNPTAEGVAIEPDPWVGGRPKLDPPGEDHSRAGHPSSTPHLPVPTEPAATPLLVSVPEPPLASPPQNLSVPTRPVPTRPPQNLSVPARLSLAMLPESGTVSGLPPLNNEIHGYLIQQAGNRYIADFFQRHSAYYTQLFQMAAVQTGWRNAMAGQHREILLALLQHDWPRARLALAQHIRAQRPVVQELLRQIRATDGLRFAEQT